MQTLRITVILIAGVASAGAQAKSANGRQVTVYLSNVMTAPVQTTAQAEGLASKIFADIGVTINWLRGVPSHPKNGRDHH